MCIFFCNLGYYLTWICKVLMAVLSCDIKFTNRTRIGTKSTKVPNTICLSSNEVQTKYFKISKQCHFFGLVGKPSNAEDLVFIL